MEDTAKNGRLCGVRMIIAGGVGLALACAACSPTSPSSQADAPSEAFESMVQAPTVDEASQLATAPADPLILAEQGGRSYGLELIEGRGNNTLIVKTDSANPSFDVTQLSNPDRLVLDINSKNKIRNQEYATSGTALASKVRVGSHPGKNRVVIEMANAQDVAHAIESRDSEIIVTLAQKGSDATSAKASPDIARVSPDLNTSEVALEPAASDAEASAQAEAEAVALKEEGAPAAGRRAATETRRTLSGMSIEPAGSAENMLVADFSEAGEYNLSRTAPSEYVFTATDALIGSETAQTLLAPSKSGSIKSVRSVEDGRNVLLRIFVDPGSSLEAKSSGSKVLIQVTKDATAPIDALAQAKEPVATPDAKVTIKKESRSVTARNNAAELDDLDVEYAASAAEGPRYSGRLISLDLQDTDIDNALRIIAEVSNLNIIASDDVSGKVTLRLIDVPWDQALDVILKTNGLDKVQEGNVVRIAPVEKLRQERESLKQARQAEQELEPLAVRYLRISYAKAADLKPLVEAVLSERGSASYDERTNQVIIKDIRQGLRNVVELVNKLDLRTPQVLLETQIVEANRTLLRDLGAELGFQYIQSPATGNATGMNFPNAISFGGSAGPGNSAASFPAAISEGSGSAVSLLLESADGTKALGARISALEREGRIRVVSRPAVATTNNKPATIKSVEKIRVKTPSGGLSVATGSGAQASGSAAVATETIEIGITLEVTPQASPDYYVLLDIAAKSSNFGGRTVEGIPSEIERSATSTVLVSSGQTFAMGGIYKLVDNNTLEGVPFLKDIPFLGHLFRRSLVDNSDEELLFFITPRIVEGSFDDAVMKVGT